MLRPTARMPAAMLVWPAMRSAPIASLRSVAMTRGALPTRIWERSSSKITSRTQWMRFWKLSRSCRDRWPSRPLEEGAVVSAWGHKRLEAA